MSPNRPLIAIVDDEEDIVLFLRMALEDNGYGVVSTSSSEGALSVLVDSEPDLICLDLLMPGQTGASLYREIRGRKILDDCPVVIMSGLGVRSEVEALLRGDGRIESPAAFLEKPIDVDEILGTISALIGRVDPDGGGGS